MLNIALFGPPGAGKGTQSKLLIEKYNLIYISTGDILRNEIAEGTELGLKAKSIIDQGGLVPDEIIVQILEKTILMNPEASGFLFDGFPRTVVQAYILEGLMYKLNTSLTCMISLEVPREELLKRLTGRAKTSGRSDDSIEVIQKRLKEYEEKTKPVADFYKEKGILHRINGVGNVEEIHQQICDTIDGYLKNKWVNIILFGYPGAGKGTQAKRISREYNMVYISTGEMLRNEVAQKTEIGAIVEPYMKSGLIVPDEIAIKLIEQKIQTHPHASGFLFKGFPRNLVQAYILDGLLRKMGSSLSFMIDFHIPPLEAIKRLAARAKSPKAREYDMKTELIVQRLEEYERVSLPVVRYYEKHKKIFIVDAMGTEDEVYQRVKEVMDKVRNRFLF